MKVIINTCWGGYNLSQEALKRYIELKELKLFSDDKGSYYYVPVEEYKKALAEDEKNNRGYTSNRLCWGENNIKRNDDILIKVIEELGEKANGEYSRLKIVEIPDDIKWKIENYDGCEYVVEVHRRWS